MTIPGRAAGGNGANALIETLLRCGVDTCFANPGTSEMHIVDALDAHPEMRTVLCLFEGVAAGAADGYSRMTRRPAATLLHLGVGLSNASAYLHNARRGHTPIVVLVGDHASYHSLLDSPLTSDIEGMARTVSSWVERVQDPRSVGGDTARAVAAAVTPPGGIATLVIPADAAWSSPGRRGVPMIPPVPVVVDDDTIAGAADVLRAPGRTALLLGGDTLQRPGLRLAGRIAAATGAELFCDTFPARLRRGAGEVVVQKLPYFAEQATKLLDGVGHLILVGTRPPVSFFAVPNQPSTLTPEGAALTTLTLPHEDALDALSRLAAALDAPEVPAHIAPTGPTPEASDRFNQHSVGAVIGKYLPPEAIVVDEAITSSVGPYNGTATAAAHDYLALTGGAIGHGLAMAVGAAVACPDRKVVCLHGDGGALYTLQSLWTMAREQLDVTIIVFNNAAYAILDVEFTRIGAAPAGAIAQSMFTLDKPTLDWPSLARGMGVEATRVSSVDAFEHSFAAAIDTRAPHLIEIAL